MKLSEYIHDLQKIFDSDGELMVMEILNGYYVNVSAPEAVNDDPFRKVFCDPTIITRFVIVNP